MKLDNLDGLEGAFNDAPSIATANAWLDAATEAYKADNISLRELRTIGDAVRTWARVAGIKIPEGDGHYGCTPT